MSLENGLSFLIKHLLKAAQCFIPAANRRHPSDHAIDNFAERLGGSVGTRRNMPANKLKRTNAVKRSRCICFYDQILLVNASMRSLPCPVDACKHLGGVK